MIPMRENSEVVIIYTDKYANTATVYPPMVTHGNNWILGLFPAGHFLEITTAGNESNLRKNNPSVSNNVLPNGKSPV